MTNPAVSGTHPSTSSPLAAARAGEDWLRALYQQIVETAAEGIWVADPTGHTLFVNRRMADMLGHAPEDMLGRAVDEFLAPGEELHFPTRASLAGAATKRDVRFRRADGTSLLAIVGMSRLAHGDGSHAGCLAMVTDISDRKALEAKLVLSDRMSSLGTMAAGVAHEINNPLAYVMASIAFVSEELAAARRLGFANLNVTEITSALRDAREGAERVRQIVRDLRTFSRGDEETIAPIDVNRILESSINMSWNEIRHRGRLVKDLSPVPPVEGNESRLGQVFLNLLVNAAHALPEGAAEKHAIHVSTATDASGAVVIEVRDSGMGIAPDIQSSIFTPFFTTKPVGVGTGLGLSICHSIVEAMNGRISFETEEGQGTTFRVVLPAASRITRPTPVQHVPPAGRRGRIMVVDDEPTICSATRRALSGEHEVVTFTDPRAAREALRTDTPFDLILCDVMMPEMSGVEFHASVAQQSPELADRIVFLTGGAFTDRAREFLASVPNQRLDKPFEVQALRAMIRYRIAGAPADREIQT